MRSIFSVLVAITIAVPVTAQCTSYQGYGASAAQSISLYVGSGWGSNPPPISSAVSMWKTDCFGMSGRDFPYLSTGTSGDVSIAVSYKTGPNPISGGGCAHFDHELSSNSAVVGGTIFVYSQTHAGADCLWVMPHATLDNLIAHELGHVLGLANATNPSCGDYIWEMIGHRRPFNRTNASTSTMRGIYRTKWRILLQTRRLACRVVPLRLSSVWREVTV